MNRLSTSPNHRSPARKVLPFAAFCLGAGALAGVYGSLRGAQSTHLQGTVVAPDCTRPSLTDSLSALDSNQDAVIRLRYQEVQVEICEAAYKGAANLIKNYQASDGQPTSSQRKEEARDLTRPGLYEVTVSQRDNTKAVMAEFGTNPDGTPNLSDLDSLTIWRAQPGASAPDATGQGMTVLYHDRQLNIWSVSDGATTPGGERFTFSSSVVFGQDLVQAQAQAKQAEQILQTKAIVADN